MCNSVISLVICLFFNLTLVRCMQSAFYIDNGLGQSSVDRDLSFREKQEMELEILHLLGLPDRPRKMGKVPLKKSAPRFLMDIYQKMMEEDEDSHTRVRRNSDINLSGREEEQIQQSDLIMSFETIDHQVSSVRHERGKRLWFNVSEVPLAEDIVGAVLKIYQNKEVPSKRADTKYTITAYQLKTEDGERELEFISAVNTTAKYSGWLGLNLTACLATWVAFPDSNKGLYLSVHQPDRPGHEIRPEDIGLVTVRGDDESEPFMVAFLKATNHVRPRRSAKYGKTRVRKSDYTSMLRGGYKDVDIGGLCRIHTLYISFRDLKWQDWIIAPDGYAAHYCAGECNFPLNAHMNATNHAIVQTLVHLMTPTRYPKPCCAPTKLNPTSVLYFLDDKNVVLKKYTKMVVKSCGCH